jgi:hypothetical protein
MSRISQSNKSEKDERKATAELGQHHGIGSKKRMDHGHE